MAKMTKRKMVKNPQPEKNNFEKKKQLVEKTLAAPKETMEAENDDDSEKKIQELFEPYSKDQLLDFIIYASVKDATVLTRLRDAVSDRKVFAEQPRKKIDNLIKSYWLASLDTVVSQIGQTLSASRAPGATASFCGYYPSSHLPPDFTNVRFDKLGFSYGDMPAHNLLWRKCEKSLHNVAARLAAIPLVQVLDPCS